MVNRIKLNEAKSLIRKIIKEYDFDDDGTSELGGMDKRTRESLKLYQELLSKIIKVFNTTSELASFLRIFVPKNRKKGDFYFMVKTEDDYDNQPNDDEFLELKKEFRSNYNADFFTIYKVRVIDKSEHSDSKNPLVTYIDKYALHVETSDWDDVTMSYGDSYTDLQHKLRFGNYI